MIQNTVKTLSDKIAIDKTYYNFIDFTIKLLLQHIVSLGLNPQTAHC